MRFVQIPRVPGDPLEVVGEFEPRGNLCPTDSCDFLNEFGRFVAVPKDVLSQRRLWVFSENCNSIDLSKTFWWEPHELEEEFVEKVTEKYAFIGLRGAYSRRDALFVFWIEDCERPLNLCSAQCVQINDIIPAFMQRVPVVSKKCWRCNYRDFEILAFVSHTASGDFSQICPECPDYSSLLLVYDARVKDSVIVSFGKIVLTGKAATEPQNWRFWYNFHGEQIHLQRSVGPNGENANVFWFSNTTPGAYTVHYSNINYPYCIYELEINVIGVGCADSDILISRFIAPNSFIIEDASGCDVEIFTVNGEDLTTSIQR
ncbi:MAG: hypothetical protein NZ534_10960, partial [Bacteroidia bacterium]|nr:hypothetical protein [Bacteroidia bacterium]